MTEFSENPGTTSAVPANPASDRPTGPEDIDFTPRPNLGRERFDRLVERGVITPQNEGPGVVPLPVSRRKGLSSSTSPRQPGHDGAPWQRNPLQEPMRLPAVPKGSRGFSAEQRSAALSAGMRDMRFPGCEEDNLPVLPRPSRRMVLVDDTFYGQAGAMNHRPRPIREGAGKGPRGRFCPVPVRC